MYVKYKYVGEDGVLSSDFHPRRAWILLGTRSGHVEAWDYEADRSVFKFKAHAGPVRTVQFHPTLHIFLTGGDDTRLKVWNSDTRKCVVVFKGHQDYIRKAIFHPMYPWAVSCSDDCTIRFWNWMSKSAICIVNGHIHWVADIDLHVTRDLLVSSSWDATVRFWDFSALRNRTANKGEHFSISHLFGEYDVICSNILEGFSATVNWVKLHSEQPLLCVGDGKVVRIYNLDTQREVRTLAGHLGRVEGGVLLRGIEDWVNFSLITVAADKTLKVWNLRTGLTLDTLPLNQTPKFLHCCSNAQLLSLGTPNCLSVLKVYKQKPVYTVYKHHLYFIRDGWLFHVNTERKKETKLFKILGVKNLRIVGLSYNQSEHAVLVNFNKHQVHSFQLYFLQDSQQNITPRIKNAPGGYALWVSNAKFAHIDPRGEVHVKNLKNEDVNFAGFARGFLVEKSKRAEQNIPKCEQLLSGFEQNHVLQYDAAYLAHYDVQKRRRLGTALVGGKDKFKSSVWNQDGSLVALIFSKSVRICDKSLKLVGSVSLRQGKVKSGAWCPISGAFLYTTNYQLRYLCGEEEEGVVCTLPEVSYITHVQDNLVTLLKRNTDVEHLPIKSAEYQFKAAVQRGNETDIRRFATSGQLLGERILLFLKQAGRSDIAVHFVKDPAVLFSLAVELFNVPLAFSAAEQLSNPAHWERVADMALMAGDMELAERACHKGKLLAKLKFLYTITGQAEKLKKLGKIFRVRNEMSSLYEIGLILGDAELQAEVLLNTGNQQIAQLVKSRLHKSGGLKSPVPLRSSSLNWPQINVANDT